MTAPTASPFARRAAISLAIVCWYALLLQFYVSLTTARANGIPVSTAVVNYFSFFTILTNLLVALVLTFSLRRLSGTRPAPSSVVPSTLGDFTSRPTVQTATAVYIAIVGIVFSLLLRNLWDTVGLQKIANVLLHDAIPILYVLFWLAFVRKSGLRFSDIPRWLSYPLIYLAYSLIRGAITGTYPYHFIDVGKLGYGRVSLNATVLSLAFVAVSLVFVVLGRWMSRNTSE